MHPMNTYAIDANNQATSKRTAQNCHIAPSAEQRDTYQLDALPSDRTADSQTKNVNFKRKDQAKTTKLTEKNGKEHRINHNSQTRITNASTAQVITGPMIVLQDNSIRLQPLAILLVVQVFTNVVLFQCGISPFKFKSFSNKFRIWNNSSSCFMCSTSKIY